MYALHKLILSPFLVGVVFLTLSSNAYGGMRIQLRDGTTVTVPVNRDDVASIIFDQEQVETKLLETIIVPNDRPAKVKSDTVLETGRWYAIEASGVISDWPDVKDGVDAVWCYAEWRCGRNGEVWDQLRIEGKGLSEIAGKTLLYSPKHVYRVRYRGEGRQIELHCSDAQGSWSDNHGFFTVKVYQE